MTSSMKALAAGALLMGAPSFAFAGKGRGSVVSKGAGAIVRATCKANSRAAIAVEIPPPDLLYRDGKLTADLDRIELDGGVRLHQDQDAEDIEDLPRLVMTQEQADVITRLRYRGTVAARFWFALAPCGGEASRLDLVYMPLALEVFDLSSKQGLLRNRAAVTFATSGAQSAGFVPAVSK